MFSRFPNILRFLKRRRSIVSIDVGSRQIKLLEIEGSPEAPRLRSMGMATLPLGAIVDGVPKQRAVIKERLEALINNLKVASKQVVMAISGYSVIIKRIGLPREREEDLADTLEEEAEAYIPFDLSEVYLDYHVFNPKESGNLDILLVAARRDIVDEYSSLAMEAGLVPIVIGVDVLSLSNTYEYCVGDKGAALVDIGASKMTVSLWSKGGPIFVRDVAQGGNQLTSDIAKALDIPFEEAEKLKVTISPNDERFPKVKEAMEEARRRWIKEVKKALEFAKVSFGDLNVSGVYLVGGSTRIKGLLQSFQQDLDFEVYSLDPLSRLETDPQKIDQDYVRRASVQMAICFGSCLTDLVDES
ncbi:type IV pilus assembly protein PilM [Thermosulfuriphilus sp.]